MMGMPDFLKILTISAFSVNFELLSLSTILRTLLVMSVETSVFDLSGHGASCTATFKLRHFRVLPIMLRDLELKCIPNA